MSDKIKPSETFVSPNDTEFASMMKTVDPLIAFKNPFALPNTDTFDFEDHRLMLFWLPALKYMRKYYTLEDGHHITIHEAARNHLEYYSETMYYSIYWAGGDIIERIQFIDDDSRMHNRAGPCKIMNILEYDSIKVHKSEYHKTSGFQNHKFIMEYAVHGRTIDEERAKWLSTVSDTFPWTADRPMSDKEYALFLLKYVR